jgi:hypothetical protein
MQQLYNGSSTLSCCAMLVLIGQKLIFYLSARLLLLGVMMSMRKQVLVQFLEEEEAILLIGIIDNVSNIINGAKVREDRQGGHVSLNMSEFFDFQTFLSSLCPADAGH